MIHPEQTTAHKASSISLSAKFRAFESVPQEAQTCPHHGAAQPHPAWEMPSEHDSVKQDRFLSVFGHFIDYLQDARAFKTLILVSFIKCHYPDEVTPQEMLGMFCCHSSEHTQGTCDRTFCQPCTRIFYNFHICLSAKVKYFRD